MRIPLIFVLLMALGAVLAKGQAIVIHSPQPNEEICLGMPLYISATFKNPDTVVRTLQAVFEIRNAVTRVTVYRRRDTLYNMPASASIDTSFLPYATNPNLLTQLGSFDACANISALDAEGNTILDWPLADTTCGILFGIRTTNLPFHDPSNDYSLTQNGSIPDQRKWTSMGATVVEGDSLSWDPPPPRTDPSDPFGFGVMKLKSPVVRFDRTDIHGNPYTGSGVGDTFKSFPFNLKGQTEVLLTFDFQRSGKQSYQGLWDAKTLPGTEHTVCNGKGEVIRAGDSLVIEFKDTKQATCNPTRWNQIVAIGGWHDLEYQHFWLYINDSSAAYRMTGTRLTTIPLNKKYIDSDFRFRIRLKANDHSVDSVASDDDDPWYLDNINLMVPRKPEIEIMWGRVVTPYSKIPYAAAAGLPVYARVKNMGPAQELGIPFSLRVDIRDSRGTAVYFDTTSVFLPTGTDTVIRMANWNAQSAVLDTSSVYIVETRLNQNGWDSYTDDNLTHSLFYLNVEEGDNAVQEFAADDAGLTPIMGSGNDAPFVTGKPGIGIGFHQSSGNFAMKFILPQEDTLYGARVYFARAYTVEDPVSFTILQGDSASCIPGEVIWQPGTQLTFTGKRTSTDQFSAYYYPTPIVLPPGIYWLTVTQPVPADFMIGGDLSRGGGLVTVADSAAPEIASLYSTYGTQWSPTQNSGDVSCMFAVEAPAGSGLWLPAMPKKGWWPINTSGNTQQMNSWDPHLAPPYINGGSYLPMIRPMIGRLPATQVHVARRTQDNFTLEQSYPNPFDPHNGSTELNFVLTESAPVSLIVYDAIGREIRTLINQTLSAGRHTTRWDGKDASGNYVPAGSYLCRLSNDIQAASIRIIVTE